MPEIFGDPTHIQPPVGDDSPDPGLEPEGFEDSDNPNEQIDLDDLAGKDAAKTADELATPRTEMGSDINPESDTVTELASTAEKYKVQDEQICENIKKDKMLLWIQNRDYTHFTPEFFDKRLNVFFRELDGIISNADLSINRKFNRMFDAKESFKRDMTNASIVAEERFYEVQKIIRAEYVDQKMDEIAEGFYGIIDKIEDEKARKQKTKELGDKMYQLSVRINDLIESCESDLNGVKEKLNDYIQEFERDFRATL